MQLDAFSSNRMYCKFAKKCTFVKVKTPWQKNEIQVIIMEIIQSYKTLSNKNNRAELIFLFNIGLSRLINMLSFISKKNLLVPLAEIVKSWNNGSWLQNKRWSGIELSTTFLKINGEMQMCSLDFTFKCLSVLSQ